MNKLAYLILNVMKDMEAFSKMSSVTANDIHYEIRESRYSYSAVYKKLQWLMAVGRVARGIKEGNLATAIASGDYSAQETVATGTVVPSYFAEHLTTLKGIDFSKVDIITISYGTNDWFTGDVQDNPNNRLDITTYAGALRYAVETIGTAYPNVRFVICTPLWRCWFTDGVLTEDSDTKLRNGVLLSAFADKAKAVAAEYHLPVCDFHTQMALNKFSWPAFFGSTDGTHPHAGGRKLMAKKLAQVIANM